MNTAFVARMEDVLAVYARPYDPWFPVVCFDERPCVLHGSPPSRCHSWRRSPPWTTNPPNRVAPGARGAPTCARARPACWRPSSRARGQRLVEVSARCTGSDYCRFLQQLAAYPQAERIVLVQDNLNTHTDAVFYQYLPAKEVRALAARFEVHYMPKNASWLNMVELELLASACTSASLP